MIVEKGLEHLNGHNVRQYVLIGYSVENHNKWVTASLLYFFESSTILFMLLVLANAIYLLCLTPISDVIFFAVVLQSFFFLYNSIVI